MIPHKPAFYKFVEYGGSGISKQIMAYPLRRIGAWEDHSFRGVFR